MRKLASVQRVSDLYPIYVIADNGQLEPASNIILAQVEGWRVVIRKEAFQIGDMGIFFEVDSILPSAEWANKLELRKNRIKTKKFGKFCYERDGKMQPVISQGLLLTAEEVGLNPDYMSMDLDLTDVIKVRKWEREETNNKDVLGEFHPIIPKTDELRVQSNLYLLEELQGKPYIITEKYDGTSCTIVCENDGSVHVYSRNLEMKDTSFYWDVLQHNGVIDGVRNYHAMSGFGIAIQGEIIGTKIQNNRVTGGRREFYAFTVYIALKPDEWQVLPLFEGCLLNICKTVPILEEGESFNYSLEQLEDYVLELRYPSGHYSEGIVIRSEETDTTGLGFLVSLKVINPNYLLTIGE